MRILLDNCVDVRLRESFAGHEAVHARDLGWRELTNGKLIQAAVDEGFEVLVTTDKNMRHQLNFSELRLSLVTLSPLFTQLEYLRPLMRQVLARLSEPPPLGFDILIVPASD
jgi:predicted nuclease of predicted toxin-antitoxin system